MKRGLYVGVAAIILVFACAALNCTVTDPEDFTGAWYRAEDCALYLFEEGIIECIDYEAIVLNETVFSGAYSFAQDKAAIFVVDNHGVSEVAELFLVHRFGGDVLCSTKDGTGTIWFYRNREAALR